MSAPAGERVRAEATASLGASGFTVLDVLAPEDPYGLVDGETPFVRFEFADGRGGAHGAKALYGGPGRADPLFVWVSWLPLDADPYPVAAPPGVGSLAARGVAGLGSTLGVSNDDVRLAVAALASPALRALVDPGPRSTRDRVEEALGDEDGDGTDLTRALVEVLRLGEVEPETLALARPVLDLAVTGAPLTWVARRLGLGAPR